MTLRKGQICACFKECRKPCQQSVREDVLCMSGGDVVILNQEDDHAIKMVCDVESNFYRERLTAVPTVLGPNRFPEWMTDTISTSRDAASLSRR